MMPSSRKGKFTKFVCALASLLVAACGSADEELAVQCAAVGADAVIEITGGFFLKGSDVHYMEETPAYREAVRTFRIDTYEVTNRAFAKFVAETGYVTVAERIPDPALHPGIPAEQLVAGAAVFLTTASDKIGGRWAFVEGASWRTPAGPDTTVEEQMDHPVVQIAYEDAMAYANWAGGDLPTEAEWEFAARGGLNGAAYEWGDTSPNKLNAPRANTWQGIFPAVNTGADGFMGTAPVGCYAPNGYGLHDMTGNVWEWVKKTDGGGNRGMIKGGSYLCAENFCRRYRPAARQVQELDFSTNHIGFRVIYRDPEPTP